MLIAYYISGHGFGHATRSIEIIRTLLTREPGVRVLVRTSVPRWLFDAPLHADERRVTIEPAETDTGIVQIDSLRLDEEATVECAAAFYADFDRRIADEAALIAGRGASLVIGDIPPLAFAAAARAGVPSIAIGNFTWDWIYDAYTGFGRRAPDVLSRIRGAYAQATRGLRLPMHGGFEPLAGATTDIPFVARRSRLDRNETRARLGLDDTRPAVLASFGGHGLALPLDAIARERRLTLLAPEHALPGLGYEDLVAAADVVVSKPGYGIVADCAANGTPLVYTSRGRFVEYDVLVREMPRVLRCRYLPPADLLDGRWTEAIQAAIAQPAPPERADISGAQVAAAICLERVRA